MIAELNHGRATSGLLSSGLLLALLLAMPIAESAQTRDLPPIRESQSVNGEIRGEGDALSLADRVARLESLLEGQALVDMLVRIEELQKDVQELRGQNEVYAHDIEGMKKRQRDLYMDIDRRLRQLLAANPVAGTGTAPAAGMAPAGPTVATQPVAGMAQSGGSTQLAGQLAASIVAGSPAAADPMAEQGAYREAFNVLKEGRYEDAIKAFRQFLQVYPEGQYADNAVYWMGEANYVLRRFPQAIENFNQVLSQYPNSPKLADALLKIGFSHYELQAWPEARQMLEQVLKDYPDTTAAQLANNRLRQMKVDGK